MTADGEAPPGPAAATQDAATAALTTAAEVPAALLTGADAPTLEATAIGPAATPSTATDPATDPGYGTDKVKAMLAALAGEGLAGTASVALITMIHDPDTFTVAYLKTFVAELVKPVFELIGLLGQGVLWIIGLCGCSDAITVADALDRADLGDAIASADVCAPVREVWAAFELAIAAMLDFQDVVAAEQELTQTLGQAIVAGGMLTQQLIADPLALVADYLPLIKVVLDTLESAEGPVLSWLKGLVTDAKRLGQTVGLASAMILPLAVPELDPILIGIRGLELAGAMKALSELGELGKLAEVGAEDADIARAMEQFFDALRQQIAASGLANPLTGGVTEAKLDTLRKLVGVSKQTRRIRAMLEDAFVAGAKRVDLTMGTYNGMADAVGAVNIRGKLWYLFDLLESPQRNLADRALLQSTRRDLMARLWDRAHIVDQRFYTAQFADDLKAVVGWNSTGDMPCIAVTAGDHRISVQNAFEAGFGRSPLSAAEIDEFDTITKVFGRRLQITETDGRAIATYTAADGTRRTTTKTSTLVGWINETWSTFPRQHDVITASSTYSLDVLQKALAAAGR